jgi:heme A synthase
MNFEKLVERWQRVAALLATLALLVWIAIATDPLDASREILTVGIRKVLVFFALVGIGALALRYARRRRRFSD